VRDARKDELPALAAMRHRLAELLKAKDPNLWEMSQDEMNRLEQTYAEVMDGGKGRILVAADAHDRPVGMIMLRLLDSPRVEPGKMGRIDDAWVEPEWRRRGLMRELVRAAAAHAQERGYKRMILDWSAKNVASARCWRGLGFAPMIVVGTAPARDLAEKKERSSVIRSESDGRSK